MGFFKVTKDYTIDGRDYLAGDMLELTDDESFRLSRKMGYTLVEATPPEAAEYKATEAYRQAHPAPVLAPADLDQGPTDLRGFRKR